MNVCRFIESLPYNHTDCCFVCIIFFYFIFLPSQNVDVHVLMWFVPICFLTRYRRDHSHFFRPHLKCRHVVSLFWVFFFVVPCVTFGSLWLPSHNKTHHLPSAGFCCDFFCVSEIRGYDQIQTVYSWLDFFFPSLILPKMQRLILGEKTDKQPFYGVVKIRSKNPLLSN